MRRLRFSLRTLLLSITEMALGLASYRAWIDYRDYQRQRENWSRTERELTEEFVRLFDEQERSAISNWTQAEVLDMIIADADFETMFRIRYWCMKNRSRMIPQLIPLLTNRGQPGLKNSADLIIPDRIAAGNLQFYGHGWIVQDDLFVVAGRASWLLKELARISHCAEETGGLLES